MTHPVTGIDHVLLMSEHLEDVAGQYARLGFTLSPLGQHPPAKGTANHTIMLQHDYIELLGIRQLTDLNRPRFEAVRRGGPGLHAICCRIEDAAAAAAALDRLGIATEGLNSFDRPVPLPDGSRGRAAFTTLNFLKPDVPIGLLFMCQHRSPETVWLPDLMQHPNSALGIAATVAISDDPLADAGRFARCMTGGSVTRMDGGASVATGVNSARLDLMQRSALQRNYPADWLNATPLNGHAVLQVRVAEMDQARACLDRAGIPARATPSGHIVPPDLAGGVIIEFVAE